jgi:hypothetical protein
VKRKSTIKKAERELLLKQAQPVPMPVACSLVYHHLNRDIGEDLSSRSYSTSLCATALALSQVADVYYIEGGKLLRIPSEELVVGSFEDRGETYRAASGKVYLALSMRRIDLMDAMSVLRKARAVIDRAKVKVRNQD